MQRTIIAVHDHSRTTSWPDPVLQRSFLRDFAEMARGLRHVVVRVCPVDEVADHFATALQSGPAVLVPSDVPHLPIWRINDAFTHLETACDLVIGPTEDGNCYLIGVRRYMEIELDAESILDESPRDIATLATSYGWQSRLLPLWYRIRSTADMQRLRSELAPFDPQTLRHTRRYLDDVHLNVNEYGA